MDGTLGRGLRPLTRLSTRWANSRDRWVPLGPYHPSSQRSGHTLPTLADLTQGAAPPPPHQPPPRYAQHQQPPHSGSHSLPGITQQMQHSPPQSSINRDRERESRDRERELLERHREMHREDEMMHREREMRERENREREQMERFHRDQQQQQHHPVQSHTGSIPIHQPVASKVPNSIHGPNGLLSNLGGNAPSNAPQGSLQGPNAPGGLFGSQLQHSDGPSRPYLHQVQGPPQQSLLPFNGNAPQMPGGVAALAQGQQPILNDALSYLDQVKVRFVDQPDVYNRFLDIMKDFKSQAIDTPGVIQRVSTLFNGHPALIQGFNTFLPPGYRIECGTADNPDAIRVTTPSGTNTISMQAGRASLDAGAEGPQPGGLIHSRPEYYDQSRPGWQQSQPQGPQQQPQGPGPVSYSPKNRGMQPGVYGQQGAPDQPREPLYEYQGQQDQQAAGNAALVHQQEQRGVAQLQSAVSSATAGRGPMMQLPGGSQTPGPNQPMGNLGGLGHGGLQSDMGKRGPVEFNHAISYVNKIKNRFADSPEIYKQFLEILQTYQRESKPIQDVYSQVTVLFNTAPDLLEDFKQFLPESAAAAKAHAQARQAAEEAAVSNVRGEPGYGASAQLGPGQTARGDVKMPPLGQFNVKETGKESKKRRGAPGTQVAGSAAIAGPSTAAADVGQANRGQPAPAGSANKRAKLNHKPAAPEMPVAVSPTLVPALPEPIPPSFSITPSHEEYAFFDRVKKYIGNKQTFGEFLKLCNLYSADLIDRNVLVNKAAGYIGANQEIMSWFKRFMHVEPKDEIIEPKARPESNTVNLAHCRSLGPSYRLLPKRERQKPCSGRDELCQSVLNDQWASHPTWASEDSGFVAHRKNQFEDALHRIEEDRHDYDHNIESCIRSIQLMEPLVQQMALMTDAERASFKLPPGLGGQSEAIYKRIIKKIYDRTRGQEVIDEMFARPCVVLPIVLARLKQKCEEWKATQREWEKVWREQMQKGFWRSLDHQAVAMKAGDKKAFVAKHIHSDIQTKFEEARNTRKSGYSAPRHQFEFEFKDTEVILDATHLLLLYIDRNSSTASNFGPDPHKAMVFIRDFIPVFLGMDREAFKAYLNEVYETTPPSEENEDESLPPEETPIPRPRRTIANGRKLDLLRDVLERRAEQSNRSDREGSLPTGSRASTPDAGSRVGSTPAPDSTDNILDSAELRWMEHPSGGNFKQEREVALNESYKKKVYPMYASLHIYCFVRCFEHLYSRLLGVKQHEEEAHDSVRRALAPKAAFDLGMIEKSPEDLLYDADPKANFYQQIVQMCEQTIKNELDPMHLEETLRRYYLGVGHQLYGLDRMLLAIGKYASLIFTSDPKDKSADIVNLFFKERDKEETTHNQEIQYRKQVEKLIKDGDLFKLTFIPDTRRVTAQLMNPEDSTLENEDLTPEARWSYYVSSYTMRDPTEGVPISEMQMPFLKRNLPSKMDSEEEFNAYYKPLVSNEGLTHRICANSYHMLYEPNTEEWAYRLPNSDMDQTAVKEKRKDRFKERFVNNPSWAHGLSKDEVDQSNQQFRSWVGDAAEPQRNGDAAGAENGDAEEKKADGGKENQEDEEMTEAPGESAPAS